MEPVKVNIIASSARCWLWPEFMESLKENEIQPFVTFAGPLDSYQTRYFITKYQNLTYVHTPVKPAQCYQIAYMYAELNSLILWAADDCEFEPGLIDKLVKFYQELNNHKAVVSVRTDENNHNYGANIHRLLEFNVNTPLMAPLGLCSHQYITMLGGFDRRFVSGQWENDFCMRVYQDGGTVVAYEPGPTITIDHNKKHGNSTKFWSGYRGDRVTLENIWVKGGYRNPTNYAKVTLADGTVHECFKLLDNREVLKYPQSEFEPYDDGPDLLLKNQGPAGIFEIKDDKKEPEPVLAFPAESEQK